MRKLVLFMHTTLDGLVAGPQGEMDWINVDEEIFDYVSKTTDVADTALYGRVTYEMMEGYWPTAADQPNASRHDIDHSRWYKKVDKVVISRTMKESKLANTLIISENLSAELKKVKETAGRDILMFGSPGAAHSLMKENLIDEYWLFVNPILLGKGTPLFSEIGELTKLKLKSHHLFSSGVICLHYAVDR